MGDGFLKTQRLPAAFVDLSAFDQNITSIASWIPKGSPLSIRVASKSVRVPALLKRILDYGPPYRGIMCYSAEEARFLADQGFDDLLVAYPTLQVSDLAALRATHEAGKKIS